MVTPAGGAAARLPFDDAAQDAPHMAKIIPLHPTKEPTVLEQYQRQLEMMRQNIAEREARGEKPEHLQHQSGVALYGRIMEDGFVEQVTSQSDRSIFSSAFAHIPR